ncbi:MAG TPA: discoidin domain-containing protein [Candidatus Faeciplasma pullistercoris]|uniref:Discoidin domain-containing protein n=1 Tax=Candidatus Faeciplasma pullistercoris TaxID=2840800 RepID=A0A9D1GVH1_9FIRM|nr:discoidin domain-containing protein [Candidatus Faeciplasma pullistercoris]
MHKFKRVISMMLCLCMLGSAAACEQTDTGGKNNGEEDLQEEEWANLEIINPEDYEIDGVVSISPLKASTMNDGIFQGWGTSLCWWANRVGYSDELAQQTADLFFGDDGLRLNIMRYNIGGGDDPTHNHITRTDSAVPGWLVWDEEAQDYVYDYDADKNQLNVLERCVEAAGDNAIVEVFSNSPPYFMTVSGCSSGGFDSNVNNLKDECYEDFAEYLAHVTNYIQNEMGIEVTSVSPMNEPNTNFWGANSPKQEGCHFDEGESQSRIIELTYEALQQYDLPNVMVVASDETSTELQINEYNAYSDKAKEYLGRINTHTYNPTKIGELGQLARDEGFLMWMSEVDGNGIAGTNAGEMGAGLWLGEKIINDINALDPAAWVLWQVIDKHISEEGYNGRQDSGMIDITQGFWGTAVADHDNQDVILTQKYYSFGQFTRYIRPGMTIIQCGGDSLAAYNPETKELVVVALNKSDKDRYMNYDLSQMESVGRRVQAIRTSGTIEDGEHWAQLEDFGAYEDGFVAELKANSITTFIVSGVELGNVTFEKVSMDGATVTGSAAWNNGDDTFDKVIDGDPNTFFDGLAEGWVEIDLGKKLKFDTLGFAPRAGYESRMTGGVFYGSNNGKDWKEIYTVKFSPASGINYIKLDKEQNYRYIRYEVPEGRAEGANEDYLCNIAEIELYREVE